MDIVKQNINDLTAEITITLGPADYEERVNEGIKKVQKKANLPGFRPGKVPQGLIRKQYGKEILIDELNRILSESLNKYLEENKIDILGSPLPRDQETPDFVHQRDFRFVYELGLLPYFDVQVDRNVTFDYKTVEIDNDLIDKYVKDTRKNYGTPVYPEVSGEKDVIFVDINEIEPAGSEGQVAIKPGGIFKKDRIKLEELKNEKAKSMLLGVKNEDVIVLNVNDLYQTATDKSLALGLDKEAAENFSGDIQITVKNIMRIEEAAVNQDLFDKLYGPGTITTEEEFLEKVKEELKQMFRGDSERKFRNHVIDNLVEKTKIQLPDEFLKKWLRTVNEKPISDEDLEKDYPSYAKSLRWQLIENKLIKEHNLKVEASEAKEEAANYVRNEYMRYGQTPNDQDIENLVREMLGKEKEARKVYDNLYLKKVIELLKDKCTVEEKVVDYANFFSE